ncbi:deaminase [Roseovarius ramblicola]|uniref:Deaminase n=1 Tax=Roseovarius ramblicola TaxID=2022336 RepID=A0ABV5I433_9RHOB
MRRGADAGPMPDPVIPTAPERQALSEICDWALRLAEGEGAPKFTAAILHGDAEIARARNEVAATCDPSRHAEIVAIAAAARRLGRRDLSGHTLLSSCQPCEMCLAAMRWARIDRLIFAARRESLGAGFFQFGALDIGDLARASGHAFAYLGGVGEARVLPLYRPQDESGDA